MIYLQLIPLSLALVLAICLYKTLKKLEDTELDLRSSKMEAEILKEKIKELEKEK